MHGKNKRKQPRVIVFTAPTCGFCRTVKRYLRQRSIRFKEVDVSRDAAAARDIVRRTGQQEVPVIYIETSPNSIEAFRLPFEAEKCK
ncbi:MAG: glutaredoxin family protein [Chloroflexi bacterium]|nr:glutaredoxin family protein [Chloroflexota bacterium]